MPGFEVFGDEERKEVNDVLATGSLFRYDYNAKPDRSYKVKQFETDFAKYTGAKHCLLVSSGTTALATVLASAGIGYGDEVIVPPFTFVASIEAVLNVGAVPIFAEIDETLCLAPDKIESKITPRTKAILVVHMCGAMAQIEKIKEIADTHNIILIEDACQATGAFYNGKSAGTFGLAGCFSFDSVKIITCGEAGGIITNDDNLFTICDKYHDHGHDHIGGNRGAETHTIVGMNYRSNELNAAVGVAQLRKLNNIIEIQKRNATRIQHSLLKYDFIRLRKIISETADTWTFVNFLCQTEEQARRVASELNNNGANGCAYWYDNNWHYLRNWHHIKNLDYPMTLAQKQLSNLPNYHTVELPQSDDIMKRTISMQIRLSWTEDELSERCKSIETVLSKI